MHLCAYKALYNMPEEYVEAIRFDEEYVNLK